MPLYDSDPTLRAVAPTRLYQPLKTNYGIPDPNKTPPPPNTNPLPTNAAGVTPNSPIPGVDPFRIAQANDAYNRALASINSQRASTLTSYGFKATGYDDSGNPIGLEVDPNSMYGQYQRLLDSQARASMSAADDAGDRGFTGGLANQGESALNYAQGADRLTLGSNLLGGLGSLNQQLLAAKKAEDDELYQAQLDAARSAFDAADYIQVPSDPYSNPAIGPGTTPETPVPSKSPSKPAVAATKRATTLAKKIVAKKSPVYAKKVTANKTGASAQRGRGVFAIH